MQPNSLTRFTRCAGKPGLVLLTAALALLSACGGGGGGNSGATQLPAATASTPATNPAQTSPAPATETATGTTQQSTILPDTNTSVSPPPSPARTVALVVASDVLQAASADVAALADAIARERNVSAKIMTAPGTAAAVRAFLQKEQNLWGVMLIGDVPAPRTKANGETYPDDNPYRLPACDAYRFDSDGNTLTVDSRIYLAATQCRNGNWTSRIKGRTPATQLADVTGFLKKDLRLRASLNSWSRQYTYVHGGWFGGVETPDFLKFWTNNSLYSGSQLGYVTSGTAAQRKDAFTGCLLAPNEFCTANVHGDQSGIAFEGPGVIGEAYSSDVARLSSKDLAQLPVHAKVVHLISCSTGNFFASSTDGYFAGNALFAGDTLLVMASAATIISSSFYEQVQVEKKYHLLANGASFADIDSLELTPLQYFGDPTISLRPQPAGDQPKLVIDNGRYPGPSTVLPVRMPDSVAGEKVQKPIVLGNTGKADLKIQLTIMPRFLGIDNVLPACSPGVCSGLGYTLDAPTAVTESGFTDLGNVVLTIKPGETLTLSYGFAPVRPWTATSGEGSPIYGNYTARMEIHSNDPELGRVFLEFAGNARAR